jgi:MucR family transcriptional regulator, transcriptional regulator of exopolysaccharide biosynthesis
MLVNWRKGETLMPAEAQSTTMNRELAMKIVAAYVRRNQIAADQIGTLISAVHQALAGAGKPAEEPEVLTPAVPVRRSVQQDRVICLECGWGGKMLRRHISGHGMSADEYRRRWSLPPDHALVAPAYAEFRSEFAKQAGLGRRRGNGASPKEPASELPAGSPKAKKPRPQSRGSRRRAKAEFQASAQS